MPGSSFLSTSVLLPSSVNFHTKGSFNICYLLCVVWSGSIFNINNHRGFFTYFLGKINLSHTLLSSCLRNWVGADLTNKLNILLGLPVVFFAIVVHDICNMAGSVATLVCTKLITTTAEASASESTTRLLNCTSNEGSLFGFTTSESLSSILLLWFLLWLFGLDFFPLTVHF